MTDRDRQQGSGSIKDNVQDELEDASKRKKGTSKEVVKEEESTVSRTGSTKDNVKDELAETQRR